MSRKHGHVIGDKATQYASEYFREKWDIGVSLKTLSDYQAKHGAK